MMDRCLLEERSPKVSKHSRAIVFVSAEVGDNQDSTSIASSCLRGEEKEWKCSIQIIEFYNQLCRQTPDNQAIALLWQDV